MWPNLARVIDLQEFMGRRPVTPQARRCGTFAAPGATSSPERGVAEAPCPTGAIVVEPEREAPRRAQSGLVRGGRREPISRQPPRADLPRDLPKQLAPTEPSRMSCL
jgi:hypothetical protein